MKASLQFRLGQQQTLSPQMQQAIQLLQLPRLDLVSRVQEALETNVMLEQERPEQPAEDALRETRSTSGEREVETDWSSADSPMDAGIGTWGGGGEDGVEPVLGAAVPTLRSHLFEQVDLLSLEPGERLLAEAIVDALDDDGYLHDSPEMVCEGLYDEEDDVRPNAVLRRVQSLDPAGIAARDLAECLDIQLRQLEPETPGLALARRLVAGHLESMARGDVDTIARKLDTDEASVREAMSLIRTLNPRPGSSLSGSAPEYVVPDVLVRRQDGRWRVELNADTLPRIRVNTTYADAVSGRRGVDSQLRSQLQEARWLVRSLEIRNETLLRVSSAIVSAQQEFLEEGDTAMRPMVLKDIAEQVDMHESTISRVTSGKYMHTPRGIYELRYFFSSHVRTTDGGEASATAIRAMIRKLIGEEDPKRPLSDKRISDTLRTTGIEVARRTVTKYRESLNIPSSTDRRRISNSLNH